MGQPINRVVVLGGGSAGSMAALTLKTMLPELNVTLVHSSDLPPIGVGESTTSLLPRFLHDGLRLDRQAFYDEVRPTWKLGIRFDWGPPGTGHFYYPFDGPLEGREGTLGKENAYYYFADGRLFAIGSAAGRIVEIVDWDTAQVNVYQSFGKTGSASAGSWATTGLAINDLEYYDGFWYATSYFSPSFAGGTDFDANGSPSGRY